MRISDWSSDVCSSDLLFRRVAAMPDILIVYYSRGGSVAQLARHIARGVGEVSDMQARLRTVPPVAALTQQAAPPVPEDGAPYVHRDDLAQCRSEERRVGERVCQYV